MRRTWIPIALALACAAALVPPATARPSDAARSKAPEPTYTSGRLVIHVEPGARPPLGTLDRTLDVRGRKTVPALGVVAVDLPPGADLEAAATRYRSMDGVRRVERSMRRRIASHPPNDPGFANQYHLPTIGVPSAWHVTGGGNRRVAVIDTGVDATHPDLSGRVLVGYNAIDGSTNTEDENGHGTAVAGVIAAVVNNGAGVAGVSKTDPILPIKVIGPDGSGDDVDVADGMVWAADKGAKIINLSLGGIGYSSVVDQAAAYARSKGALVIAATGNEGISVPNHPAALPGVLAVGATDADDEIPFWSGGAAPNYGSWIDVVAPGDAILTTVPGGYAFVTGTSLATPVVAGAAALTWAANPSFTQAQVAARLRATADDLGLPGVDRFYGHGRINAHRAVGGSPAAALSQDEPDGEAGDTSDDGLPLDGSMSATIYPAGDRDWYDVTVEAGEWLHVVVDPPTEIDPLFEIYGPDNSLVHYQDEGFFGETEDAKIDLDGVAGTYHVGVRNWLPNGVASFDYEITATTGTGPTTPPAEPPTSLRRSFFTWYDAVNSKRRNWLMTANVGATPGIYSATIASDDMFVDPDLVFVRPLAAGETDPKVFGGLVNGPVEVRWPAGDPLIASQRVLWKPDNFEEVAAVGDADLTTHAWFTWYDGVNTGGKDWVLAANPGPWSADVQILFDGTKVATAMLGPGENLIWSDPAKIGGPVEITSDNPVLASRRTLWGGVNFSEFTGIPDDDLSDDYLFPWYDSKVTRGKNWILLSNPGDVAIAVDVRIGNPPVVTDVVPLDPGQTDHRSYADVVGGPVRVTASEPFVASQRNLFDAGRSFEEVGGVPVETLTSSAYYTWYDGVNTSGRDWVLVANPSATDTIAVAIRIAGVLQHAEDVGPGGIITPNFPGTIGGPVDVSANGPIVTSRRTLWVADFTELIGVPPPT